MTAGDTLARSSRPIQRASHARQPPSWSSARLCPKRAMYSRPGETREEPPAALVKLAWLAELEVPGLPVSEAASASAEPAGRYRSVMTMTISRTVGIVPVMKFTLETTSRVNLIRGYSSQEIRIGEQRLHASCIVSADQLIESWPPQTFAELAPEHLEAILALKPELVLLGTGPSQRFPPAAIRSAFTARGVGLEVMDLGAACRTFNILVQEERRVVAALFLS